MKPTRPLTDMPSKLLRTMLAVLLCAAFAPLAFGQSQDSWERYSQKKLAVPDTTYYRKCITISKNGIYVGKMNANGSAAVSLEQYTLAGAFVKNWTVAFTNIGGLASDADGTVYVFDQGASKVLTYDSSGAAIRNFGSPGSGDGQLSASSGWMVHGISVDAEKNVYISDRGNSRVQKFSPTGVFLLKFGAQGDLPGQFRDGPTAVAATPQGTVITCESPSNFWYHLSIFSSDGKLLKRGQHSVGWGGHKSFSVSTDGILMLWNEYNFQAFSTATLNEITSPSFPSHVETRGTAFDPSGNFWAVRDKEVECLLRRMRFDSHIPTKALPQAVVTKVSQVPGSKIVDIDFKVSDTDSASVTVALLANLSPSSGLWSGMVVPKTFTSATSGRLGAGVVAGGTYTVSWDAATDLPGKNFATLSFSIMAKDDRPEIGVHYVTIPADASNASPLKISSAPMGETDLWDLWRWLLATGDSRVAISGNSVVLTAAGQAFIADAPLPTNGTSSPSVAHTGSTSTRQGRAFACKLLGCRPATAAEVTRAGAGRFNLSGGVNYNSVVLPTP
jgi:hypothetical protein